MADGIGDTIRVSLAEAPENEIPVAKELAEYIAQRKEHYIIEGRIANGFSYTNPQRRFTVATDCIGGNNVPVVVSRFAKDDTLMPDFVISDGVITHCGKTINLIDLADISKTEAEAVTFIPMQYRDIDTAVVEKLKQHRNIAIIAYSNHKNPVGELRALVHKLTEEGITAPIIIRRDYEETTIESLRIKAAADLGVMLIDGLADGVWIENPGIEPQLINALAFGILQATRTRISKTEYIACPGCGRTMYDLQGTLARIKAATSHLKGLKIGVMGCIVNGPGEMADADYGYVGAARGKVSLYRKKTCVEKNIPEEEAIERLLQLIEGD